jgi:biotin carboxylase
MGLPRRTGSGRPDVTHDIEVLNVLLIGCNRALLRLLGADPETRICMLEERVLHDRRPDHYPTDVIAELRFASYQESAEAVDVAVDWAASRRFDAVIACSEYAVSACHRIASALGLPSAGHRAVTACTSKLALRLVCEDSRIRQPAYAAVASEADVGEFFARHGDLPIVLKPSDRSGSAGVVKIANQAGVSRAWKETVAAAEPSRLRRRESAGYLAEAYVAGYEVSTEALVAAGEMCFCNVTLKETTTGDYFAEVGHIAPGPIPEADRLAVWKAQEELLGLLEVTAGIFHAEWKITAEGPHLIECAARPPGDYIPIIVSRAWDFNMGAALARALAGMPVTVPSEPARWAASRFFVPPPGRVVSVSGEIELGKQACVREYEISARPGTVVGPARDTWSRGGHCLLEADTVGELRDAIEDVERIVRFEVESNDCRPISLP